MPSGAKKRKAAKKKKELEANNSPDQDDAKSQDDKGSDGSGEVSSPVHQDHNNTQHHAPEDVIEIQWSLKDEGSSSSSSRSSSDDEKKPEKEEEAHPVRAAEEKESPGSLVEEVSPVIEAVKPVEVPVSEETISYLETAPVDNVLVSEVIKSETLVVPETSAGLSLNEPQSGSDSKGYEENKTVASSEDQIPVAVAATQIRKTSVFSCCGIFEVFSASSR